LRQLFALRDSTVDQFVGLILSLRRPPKMLRMYATIVGFATGMRGFMLSAWGRTMRQPAHETGWLAPSHVSAAVWKPSERPDQATFSDMIDMLFEPFSRGAAI
jgi:hypothetical protein